MFPLQNRNSNNPLGNLIRVDNLEFCHASTPCGVPLAESGKKSERRSSSTFFCIPNLQSRLISSFGMQLIAAVNSTNWKIVVTLFMFLIGRTQLLSNSMLLTSTVENNLSKTYNKIQVEFPNCAHIYFDNQLIFAKLWSHFF